MISSEIGKGFIRVHGSFHSVNLGSSEESKRACTIKNIVDEDSQLDVLKSNSCMNPDHLRSIRIDMGEADEIEVGSSWVEQNEHTQPGESSPPRPPHTPQQMGKTSPKCFKNQRSTSTTEPSTPVPIKSQIVEDTPATDTRFRSALPEEGAIPNNGSMTAKPKGDKSSPLGRSGTPVAQISIDNRDTAEPNLSNLKPMDGCLELRTNSSPEGNIPSSPPQLVSEQVKEGEVNVSMEPIQESEKSNEEAVTNQDDSNEGPHTANSKAQHAEQSTGENYHSAKEKVCESTRDDGLSPKNELEEFVVSEDNANIQERVCALDCQDLDEPSQLRSRESDQTQAQERASTGIPHQGSPEQAEDISPTEWNPLRVTAPAPTDCQTRKDFETPSEDARDRNAQESHKRKFEDRLSHAESLPSTPAKKLKFTPNDTASYEAENDQENAETPRSSEEKHAEDVTRVTAKGRGRPKKHTNVEEQLTDTSTPVKKSLKRKSDVSGVWTGSAKRTRFSSEEKFLAIHGDNRNPDDNKMAGIRALFSNSVVLETPEMRNFFDEQKLQVASKVKSESFDILVVGSGPLKKTFKLLMAVALGRRVVTDFWITESQKAGRMLPSKSFKARKGLDTSPTLNRSTLFKGKSFVITPALKRFYGKVYGEVQQLIREVGAKDMTCKAAGDLHAQSHTVVMGLDKDDKDCIALQERGVVCFNKDLLPSAVLKGQDYLNGSKYRIVSQTSLKKRGRGSSVNARPDSPAGSGEASALKGKRGRPRSC